jgi:hypothetical protein
VLELVDVGDKDKAKRRVGARLLRSRHATIIMYPSQGAAKLTKVKTRPLAKC